MKEIIRNIGKQTIVFVVLMAVMFYFYFLIKDCLVRENDQKHLKVDDYTCMFQVENVWTDEKEFFMEGWAFRIGRDSTNKDIEILLYDLVSNEIIYLKNKSIEREDVNQYFSCEYDYSKCGFIAMCDISDIEFKTSNYRVLISDAVNRVIYQTETYIVNGKIEYISPDIAWRIETNDSTLKTIVEDGIVRVFEPGIGVYVYQCSNSLYWITDKNYNNLVNGTMPISYHLHTTQYSKLPENRVIYQYDNCDFLFEDYEILQTEEGYKIAKWELPKDFSVTKVVTGHYSSEWVWRKEFRVMHDVSEQYR